MRKLQCDSFDTVIIMKCKGWFRTTELNTLLGIVSNTGPEYYDEINVTKCVMRTASHFLPADQLADAINGAISCALQYNSGSVKVSELMGRIYGRLASITIDKFTYADLTDELNLLRTRDPELAS